MFQRILNYINTLLFSEQYFLLWLDLCNGTLFLSLGCFIQWIQRFVKIFEIGIKNPFFFVVPNNIFEGYGVDESNSSTHFA